MSASPRGPGDRHGNDVADIHEVSITGTLDELRSEDPFLRPANEIYQHEPKSDRLALLLDNQFRLLREDTLRGLREELKSLTSSNKERRGGTRIQNLKLTRSGVNRCHGWCILLEGQDIYLGMPTRNRTKRRKVDNPGKLNFMTHRLITFLMADGEPVSLATFIPQEEFRDDNLPTFSLQLFPGSSQIALQKLRLAKNITLVVTNTAVFAHEHVLRQLKETKRLSLEEDILRWDRVALPPVRNFNLDPSIQEFVSSLAVGGTHDFQTALNLPTATHLDESQINCFVAAMRQRVTLIRGAPGKEIGISVRPLGRRLIIIYRDR